MKREYVKLNRSRYWHIPSEDNRTVRCDANFQLRNFQAVQKSESFPSPICLKCIRKLRSGAPYSKPFTQVDQI